MSAFQDKPGLLNAAFASTTGSARTRKPGDINVVRRELNLNSVDHTSKLSSQGPHSLIPGKILTIPAGVFIGHNFDPREDLNANSLVGPNVSEFLTGDITAVGDKETIDAEDSKMEK